MNDHPVHRDDITALKADGDLKAYMRSLIQPTKSTTPTPRKRKPKWGQIPIPEDHKPGAWPAGTQPPGRAPDRNRPTADWNDAITRYRNETRHQLDQEEQPWRPAPTSPNSSAPATPTPPSPAASAAADPPSPAPAPPSAYQPSKPSASSTPKQPPPAA